LGIAIAALAVLLAIGFAMTSHERPNNPFVYTGVVTGFSTLSSETGTEVYATVYVSRSSTAVQVDARHGCIVGGHIALRKVHVALGDMFVAPTGGCGPAPTAR
jgi:hypothetical protein